MLVVAVCALWGRGRAAAPRPTKAAKRDRAGGQGTATKAAGSSRVLLARPASPSRGVHVKSRLVHAAAGHGRGRGRARGEASQVGGGRCSVVTGTAGHQAPCRLPQQPQILAKWGTSGLPANPAAANFRRSEPLPSRARGGTPPAEKQDGTRPSRRRGPADSSGP
jgi:hypothetical protein